MAKREQIIAEGRILVSGTSNCGDIHEVLYSTVPLSFWGGIDPTTGAIIDHTHPLNGENVRDKILVIPSGRGSCTGSQVLLELILNGISPRAIVLRERDAIICTGAIVAEEVFGDEVGKSVPWIISISHDGFQSLGKTSFASIRQTPEEGTPALVFAGAEMDDLADVFNSPQPLLQHGPFSVSGKNDHFDNLHLTHEEETILHSGSPAQRIAMRTVCRIGAITNAPRLVPVCQAHIDGCTYIGPGGLRFVRKLVEMGGKVTVPTTLNSVSADRRRWDQLGVPKCTAEPANAVGDAYLQLGCIHSFTCAPYLLPTKPAFGENIIWGESNAVVFANSVLGARTDKYADYFDICCALIGKVPEIGVHLEENRMPGIIIDVSDFVANFILPLVGGNKTEALAYDVDSFYPTLGYLCGNISEGRVPLIKGMEQLLGTTSHDDLKAFCAAFGTTGTAPLVHIAGITPEAIDHVLTKPMEEDCKGNVRKISSDDMIVAFDSLDSGSGSSDTRIDMVAFGNPHLSLSECQRLSKLVTTDQMDMHIPEREVDLMSSTSGMRLQKHPKVRVMATLSRYVFDKANAKGYIKPLEDFGVQFINDTCWCMLIEPPVIPPEQKAVIMTNSGKYAHYGPGLTNRTLRFGGMADCVSAAMKGNWGVQKSRRLPRWIKRPGPISSQVRGFSSAAFLRLLKY
mmetsp:Transcript_27557/g.81080  ORF Transcript_27557/g.81080 Transcript_27557/m.81080 type:complete len:684 (-) Transcript_27557:12-2063(-)